MPLPFKKLFEDKRYTIGLLLTWMLAVCTIFYFLGAFHMSYMHLGRTGEQKNIPCLAAARNDLTTTTGTD